VLRKGGKYFLSVTFDATPESVARVAGTQSGAFDWGLAMLLTLVVGNAMGYAPFTASLPGSATILTTSSRRRWSRASG
jgi:hypothetical protein